MVTQRPRRLGPKMRELVAPDRLGRPDVGRLTGAQVEVLMAAVQNPSAFADPVSVRHALRALAIGGKPEVVTPLIAGVLADRQAAETERVVAARELGRVATPEAEAALSAHVRDRNSRVQQAVLAGLGTFAGPPVLRDLAKLTLPGDLAARRQLDFTRALIAHRHGLDGPFLPETTAVGRRRPPKEAVPVTMRARGPKATAADRERLRGSTYGIDLGDRSLALRCDRSEWTVFLNHEIAGGEATLEAVFSRPLIAGVVARWYSARVAASTQYVLLTRPADDGARVEVVRGDGEVVYAGTARPAERAVAFSLSDVERPATAPTLVAGRLRTRGVDLDAAFSASRVGTKATAPVVP